MPWPICRLTVPTYQHFIYDWRKGGTWESRSNDTWPPSYETERLVFMRTLARRISSHTIRMRRIIAWRKKYLVSRAKKWHRFLQVFLQVVHFCLQMFHGILKRCSLSELIRHIRWITGEIAWVSKCKLGHFCSYDWTWTTELLNKVFVHFHG